MSTYGSAYGATYARVAQPVAHATQPVVVSRQAATTSRHLGGLDGLRALAVAAVVVFHLDSTWLPGGFLGVDVFFVVSGFLITTLLVREAEKHQGGLLRRFWVRRARRLLPALVVCLTLSTVVARVVHPDLLVGLGRQIVGALTFTNNWVEIAAGSSYFDQTAPQLFLNVWSLAVEEQFYLVWPFVVLALVAISVRPGTRALLAGCVGLASTALMAVIYVPGHDATRVYYGTDTHLVGLMLGAALGFVWCAPDHSVLGHQVWRRARRPLLALAALGLGVMMWRLGEATPATFRGGIAAASLAATVLVAGLLPVTGAPSRWRRLLGAPLLTWVGRRSYGIYLWHWPVVVLVGLDERTTPGTTAHVVSRLWAVLVILALADLSYRFIEAPVRVWGFRAVTLMVVRGLFSPFSKVPRFVAAGVTILVAVAVVVVVTAPRETQTQALLDANSAAALPTPARTAATPGASASASASATSPVTLPSSAATARRTAPSSWAMPAGPEIDIFGDSLVVASIHALDYYFPGVRSDAKSNRQWSDGLAQLQAHTTDLRRAVVLDFGTNAGVDPATVKQALDLIGPSHLVVLVTIYGQASWIDTANAALTQAASGRSNVVLADWHGAIGAHPELLQSDGIHPTITGAHLYAKTIRAALARLSEQHTGVAVSLPDLPVY